jgi:hypothetical protein
VINKLVNHLFFYKNKKQTNKMKKATDAQIKSWKDQFGEVFEIQVEIDDEGTQEVCYAKKPSIETISLVLAIISPKETGFDAEGPTNVTEYPKALNVLYNHCLIQAPESIAKNDEAKLAVQTQMMGLFKQRVATVKKL